MWIFLSLLSSFLNMTCPFSPPFYSTYKSSIFLTHILSFKGLFCELGVCLSFCLFFFFPETMRPHQDFHLTGTLLSEVIT